MSILLISKITENAIHKFEHHQYGSFHPKTLHTFGVPASVRTFVRFATKPDRLMYASGRRQKTRYRL
jgi:hypothetical protein